MAPPCYSDIRKLFRDILNKKYNSNTWFFSYKDKYGPTDFKMHMGSVLQTKKLSASFESKFYVDQFGFTLREKIDSQNVLSSDIIFTGKLFDGLTNTFGLVYDLCTGHRKGLIKNTYKNKRINLSSQISFSSKQPDILSSVVLKYQDFLLGAEINMISSKHGTDRANFSFAYSVDDCCFYGGISNWNKSYSAGVYQKISDRLECAGETTWIRDLPDLRWALGLRLLLDSTRNHVLYVKLDNLAQISLSLSSQLASGVRASICALVNHSIHSHVGFGLHIER